MPTSPRWLLAVPDAIDQLRHLKRDLITRRDLQTLLGVAKARAATLMTELGATSTGCQKTILRTELIERLEEHRDSGAFRHETRRRAALAAELRRARAGTVKFTTPIESLSARFAAMPKGITIEPNRIEISFSSAKEALQKLFELSQLLVNDYDRFESIIEKRVTKREKPL